MTILGVVAAGALLGVVLAELSHYLAMRGVVASCRAGRSAQGRTSEAVIVLDQLQPASGRAVHRHQDRLRSLPRTQSWHVRCLTAGAG
jgi:hypothetical protein